jgi:hypothetical protein
METVAFRFCEVCRFVSPSLYLFFLHTNLCFLPVLIAPMYYDFIKVCYVCCLFHVCVFFFYLLLLLPLLSLCLHSPLCLSTLLFFCSVVIGVFFPNAFSFFRHWFTDLEDANICSSVLWSLQILFTPTVFYGVCTYDGFMPGVGISTLCSLGWPNSFLSLPLIECVDYFVVWNFWLCDFGTCCFYQDYIVFMSTGFLVAQWRFCPLWLR